MLDNGTRSLQMTVSTQRQHGHGSAIKVGDEYVFSGLIDRDISGALARGSSLIQEGQLAARRIDTKRGDSAGFVVVRRVEVVLVWVNRNRQRVPNAARSLS